VPPTPGGGLTVDVEVVRIEKRWNIASSEVPEVIAKMLRRYGDNHVVVYYHTTWGSCRVTKFVVLNVDGSYLPDGEWIDNSSRKNVHKWKVIPVEEFIAKYAGKELLAYCYVSPSCNKSKEFSFRAVFRVRGG
jgi:hypothetical protein